MKQGPKILTLDIETLPMQVHSWSLFEEPRMLDRVVKDWAVFAGAAKWLHEKRFMYLDTRCRPSPDDDEELIAWLCYLLHEADIVVGQNLQKFDLRKIRARAIAHGIAPFKEPEVIDTLLIARELGAFTSNKLEYLSGLTDERKSDHSKFPGFKLWLAIYEDNPRAWDEVRKYNIQDVKSTEKLYLELRPWAKRLPNMAKYYNDGKMHCPRCGSTKLILQEGKAMRGVSEYSQYCCTGCCGFSRSRYTQTTKDYRKGLLTCL